MSLILVLTLFRGVLWLSVMHTLICHRVWTKIPTVFKCLVSNTGQNPTKIKKTNQNKQMPAAMKVEFFTRTSVYRPYHWTVFRSEFPGFVWPIKSCIECHSHFISFITDQNSHGFILLWVVSLTSARINAIDSLCHHLQRIFESYNDFWKLFLRLVSLLI